MDTIASQTPRNGVFPGTGIQVGRWNYEPWDSQSCAEEKSSFRITLFCLGSRDANKEFYCCFLVIFYLRHVMMVFSFQ